MNKEKEADVVDRFLQEVPCHQMAYQAEPTSSSEVEGKLCFVADSQSPKIKQEPQGATSGYFSANAYGEHSNPAEPHVLFRGRGHASYIGGNASPSPLLYDFANTFPSQAPTDVAACRGYKQALQGANLLPNPLSGADQAGQASEEMRCKVLESEVKRLKQRLSRTEDDLRLKNEEVHRFRREVESCRRNVEDLQDTLNQQKDLIRVYQQLVADTSEGKNLGAQVEPLQMTSEHPQSPQPAPAAKRARPVSTGDLAVDQTTSDGKFALKGLSENMSQTDSFNPPKRARYSSEYPASEFSHGPGGKRSTLRGADHYDPPYAVKKQGAVDRYVPTTQSSNWSADRYSPSSPKALRTSTGATESLDMTLPAKPEVPRVVSTPSSTAVPPKSAGRLHPSSLKGAASGAFLRAQQLGVPYNPAKHVGIPRQCTICSVVLASGGKLERHMRVKHRLPVAHGLPSASGPWLGNGEELSGQDK